MDPFVVAEVRRYVDDLDANLDAGRGLWLMGDVGTGKTTLAMLVSQGRARAPAARSAIYSAAASCSCELRRDVRRRQRR